MSNKIFRVEIKSCRVPASWYSNLIGEVFICYKYGNGYVLKDDRDAGENSAWRHIDKSDCQATEIEEEEEEEGCTVSVRWRIHTPRLLNEILNSNPSMHALRVPMNMFGKLLGAVADRASKLNDPILNDLMCQLTLYEVADPNSKEYDKDMLDKVERLAKEYRAGNVSEGSVEL